MAKKEVSKKPVDREIAQVQFEGEEAARFRNYKSKQHLRINAEAARKLIFERLEQWEKENAA